MKADLSHEILLSLLNYQPTEGIFTWKIASSARVSIGDQAGRVARNGYLEIGIFRRSYLGHRLAWFYVHGEWPKSSVDHRDGDKLNNRIGNLRLCTISQNAANKKRPVTNSTGYKGIRQTTSGRWRAAIEKNGRYFNLGSYGSKEEARDAYIAGATQLFGEFARAA